MSTIQITDKTLVETHLEEIYLRINPVYTFISFKVFLIPELFFYDLQDLKHFTSKDSSLFCISVFYYI